MSARRTSTRTERSRRRYNNNNIIIVDGVVLLYGGIPTRSEPVRIPRYNIIRRYYCRRTRVVKPRFTNIHIVSLLQCCGRPADFRYNMLFLFCPTDRQAVAILPVCVKVINRNNLSWGEGCETNNNNINNTFIIVVGLSTER